MNADEKRAYAELLHERQPHAIRSRPAYKRALQELEELTLLGEARTKAQTEYYRILCALVADYERFVGADRWPKVDPADALRELMILRQVTPPELANALGNQAAASAILSGQRKIGKTQARKLASLLHVKPGIFS